MAPGSRNSGVKRKASVVKRGAKVAQRREARKVLEDKKLRSLAKDLGTNPELLAKIADMKNKNMHVAFIPLTADADAACARNIFVQAEGMSHACSAAGTAGWESATVVNVRHAKFKTTFVAIAAARGIEAILDAAKVADAVVFVATPTSTDTLTDEILAALEAHGAPALAFAAIMPPAPSSGAVPAADMAQFLRTRLTGARVCDFTTEEATLPGSSVLAQLTTALGRATPMPVRWTMQYPALAVQNAVYDQASRQLCVLGYLRGAPIDPERTAHLVGYGDFAVSGLHDSLAPTDRAVLLERAAVMAERNKADRAAEFSATASRPDVGDRIAAPETPDAIFNLYELDTEDCVAARQPATAEGLLAPTARAPETPAEAADRKMAEATTSRLAALMDSGMTEAEAQAALAEAEAGTGAPYVGDDEELLAAPGASARPHIRDIEGADAVASAGLEHGDIVAAQAGPGDLNYSRHVPELAERARDELDFPDEVDTPQPPVRARARFAKYRGLQSFRTSAWNPYEALPAEYAQLLQFADEDMLRREVLRTSHNEHPAVLPGRWIGIALANVSPDVAASVTAQLASPGVPLVCAGLLRHETRLTMATLAVRRVDAPVDSAVAAPTAKQADAAEHAASAGVAAPEAHAALARTPLPSKTPMVLYCGWRRLMVRPLFATHSPTARFGKAQKSRYLRFAPDDRATVAAHAYLPVVMGRSVPVLMFQAATPAADARSGAEVGMPVPTAPGHIGDYHGAPLDPSFIPADCTASATGLRLAGHYATSDPLRMIIKRVILTGYPRKINTKAAVIRWMFWLPEDVRWFSRIELTTKKGVAGHISSSVATYGAFKADFSRPVNFSDTICMRLYRRVFPPAPWTTVQLSNAGLAHWAPMTAVGSDEYSAHRANVAQTAAGEWDDDVDMVL